jgi:hypothetical protein
MKINTTLFTLPAALIFLVSCSAIDVSHYGMNVEIVAEKPKGDCVFLGEVTGSQGNWFTGGYTPDKNLIAGARNNLRNRAGEKGGNVVWIQDRHHSGAYGITHNSTVIGNVYKCK